MYLSRTLAALPVALSLVVGCASSTPQDGGNDAGSSTGGKPGFYVSGRFLYDKCGNKVVLRGVNEMIIWSSNQDGSTIYPEIAKTGANVVRIVWNATGTASTLDATIKNALDQKLIPLVEDHDATGDITKVPAVVDYWLQSDIVAVLKKYEDKILLNIANEAGATVDQDTYASTYTTAIQRLRDAGCRMPLVIDAPRYGTDIGTLLNAGPTLIAADPLANILLSVHLYWADPAGDVTRARLADAVTANMPLMVGEFADTKVGTCAHGSYDVGALMDAAQQNQIGWLAWSWGAVKNSDCTGMLDMSSDGTFAGLKDWGLAVATTDTNSIKNTSVLDPYIVSGSCN